VGSLDENCVGDFDTVGATIAGTLVARGMVVVLGTGVEYGAFRTKLLVTETVPYCVANPIFTFTVPVLGIVSEACGLEAVGRYRNPLQIPPTKNPFIVSYIKSPDVTDEVTVSVSPET